MTDHNVFEFEPPAFTHPEVSKALHRFAVELGVRMVTFDLWEVTAEQLVRLDLRIGFLCLFSGVRQSVAPEMGDAGPELR